MKKSVLFVVLILLWSGTSADRMLRVLFNKGLDFADNCTAADNVLIDAIFNNTNTVRRSTLAIGLEQHRDLAIYPLYCKNNCLGFKPGTCRATNCKGYRRGLLTTPLLSCSDQVRSINVSITSLVTQNKVSTKCKNLLNRPRTFECYNDVVYGEIEYIRAIDMKNITLSKPNTVLSICRSARFRLEVGINTCVDKIYCEVRKDGSNFFNSTLTATYPFNHIVDSYALQKGYYISTCMPDGFVNKSKSIHVDLKEC